MRAIMQRQLGMTLTEVIVAVAILALLIAGSTAGLASYAERQAFERYVSEVELSIREQRQRTIASVADTQYGVYVGTSTLAYFEGATYTFASSTEQTLPATMSATSSFSDGNWYVTFTRLTGAASATGTITLMDTNNQRTATITINALGLLE